MRLEPFDLEPYRRGEQDGPSLRWIVGVAAGIVASVFGFVVFVGLSIAMFIPSVPGNVVPSQIPDVAMVGDWERGGAEDGHGAQREFYFTSDTLTTEQSAEAVATALTEIGWRLCRPRDPYASPPFRSSADFVGEFSLVIWAHDRDGAEMSGASAIPQGAPVITVAVDSKPDPNDYEPPGGCTPF